MVYKTISPNAIIAKIYRDYKPSNSGWVNDAYEWMGEALECIKPFNGYIDTTKCVNIIDYRGKIPCDLDQLQGIEYKGKKLQRSGAINHKRRCASLDSLALCLDESYSLNPNYIHTSFQTGSVVVYYYGLATDESGMPLIADNHYVKEAISWYILSKLCLRGLKHPVVNYEMANAQWISFYPKAQNSCKMFDIDGYEVFMKTYMGLTRNTNMSQEFFQDNSAISGFSINGFPPTSSNTIL